VSDYNRGTWQEALQDLGHEVELRKAAEAERDCLRSQLQLAKAWLTAYDVCLGAHEEFEPVLRQYQSAREAFRKVIETQSREEPEK
jgi:hypothetical protein